jgi:dTDP-glucose 4,6-dehydratase
MKTILVTGGAGFIGSNFVKMMLEKHPEYKIINIDALTYAGNLENLKDIDDNPNYEFIRVDIRDRVKIEEIFKNNDIDSVVNFAAESHVVHFKNYIRSTISPHCGTSNYWRADLSNLI